jgi:hypothetical protein
MTTHENAQTPPAAGDTDTSDHLPTGPDGVSVHPRTDPAVPRWAQILLLLVPMALVVAWVGPTHVLTSERPMAGDLAAHNWWVTAFGQLLDSGHVVGWTNDVSAGWGLGYFYFPLPAALVHLLDLVLPTGTAFKLVILAGPLVFLYGCRRLLAGFNAPPVAVALAPFAALMALVPFDHAQVVMGGNMLSTYTGEFSYMLALGFGLWFLGALADTLAARRPAWPAVVLFAATLGSHLNVAIIVAVAALVVWLVVGRSRTSMARLAGVGLLGAGLCAVWLLPTVAVFGETIGNGRVSLKDTAWLHPPPWWPILALSGLALATGLLFRRRSTLLVASLTAVAALSFVLHGESIIWNGRALPFYFTMLTLLVACLAGDLAGWVRPSWARTAVVAVCAVGCVAWAQYHIAEFIPAVSGVNRGVDAYPGAEDYRDVMDAARQLPPGRAMFEVDEFAGPRYGSNFAFSALGLETNGRVTSATSLFYESSLTQPAILVTTSNVSEGALRSISDLAYGSIENFDQGVTQMRELGVRYFFVTSEAGVKRADESDQLELVATSGDLNKGPTEGWNIYEIKDWALVEPVTATPLVTGGQELYGTTSWPDQVERWWQAVGAGDPQPLIAQHGPDAWSASSGRTYPPVGVSDVQVGDERISFHVDQVGVPVVVRTSFFPNWQASGADGPYRVAPNFMVVVPTEHDVTLEFTHSPIEAVGLLVTFVSLGLTVAWAVLERHRRRNAGLSAPASSSAAGSVSPPPLDSEDSPASRPAGPPDPADQPPASGDSGPSLDPDATDPVSPDLDLTSPDAPRDVPS